MTVKSPDKIRRSAQVDLPNLTKLQRAIYQTASPILHGPDVKAYQERMRKRSQRRMWWKTFGVAIPASIAIFALLAFLGYVLLKAGSVFTLAIGMSFWAIDLAFVGAAVEGMRQIWKQPSYRSQWVSEA